jgi:hypothetical protein
LSLIWFHIYSHRRELCLNRSQIANSSRRYSCRPHHETDMKTEQFRKRELGEISAMRADLRARLPGDPLAPRCGRARRRAAARTWRIASRWRRAGARPRIAAARTSGICCTFFFLLHLHLLLPPPSPDPPSPSRTPSRITARYHSNRHCLSYHGTFCRDLLTKLFNKALTFSRQFLS